MWVEVIHGLFFSDRCPDVDSCSPLYCGFPSQLPSTEELDAVFADRKLNTIVFFLDETFEELAFDVTTTVLEAVEQLAGIIKLQVGMEGVLVGSRVCW